MHIALSQIHFDKLYIKYSRLFYALKENDKEYGKSDFKEDLSKLEYSDNDIQQAMDSFSSIQRYYKLLVESEGKIPEFNPVHNQMSQEEFERAIANSPNVTKTFRKNADTQSHLKSTTATPKLFYAIAVAISVLILIYEVSWLGKSSIAPIIIATNIAVLLVIVGITMKK
jgi:hypothetical protein